MSLYVVVEGRRTEPEIYRAWLPLLIPGYEPAARIEDVGDHHFFIVAGQGYPSYLSRIRAAVEDLRLPDSPFSHLMVCVDAEELTLDERHDEIASAIIDHACPTDYTVVIADCCMETWLLGNRSIIRRDPRDPELLTYQRHYDVSQRDPERIPHHPHHRTRAQLCVRYLRAAFRDGGRRYSKREPGDAITAPYLAALRERAAPPPEGPGHLASFARLLEVTDRLTTSGTNPAR